MVPGAIPQMTKTTIDISSSNPTTPNIPISAIQQTQTDANRSSKNENSKRRIDLVETDNSKESAITTIVNYHTGNTNKAKAARKETPELEKSVGMETDHTPCSNPPLLSRTGSCVPQRHDSPAYSLPIPSLSLKAPGRHLSH